MNWQWLILFVGQVGVGVFLYVSGDHDTAKLMFASAFGQGVTGTMKATRTAK